MTDKRELRDQDIARLLERWKKTESPYPGALKEKRRAEFLALIPGLIGMGQPHTPVKGIHGHAAPGADLPMTLPLKIVLGVLSTTIIVLSTYVGGIVYRNWVAYVNETQTPTEFSASPSHPTPSYLTAPPIYASGTAITGTPTPTPLASTTPSDVVGISGETPQPTSTVPGFHFGQTKTPRPTKTPRR